MTKEDNDMSDTINEAVGISNNLSFDEALRDALKKLSPENERPLGIVLKDIAYQPGDLAGKHYLSVHISRVGK